MCSFILLMMLRGAIGGRVSVIVVLLSQLSLLHELALQSMGSRLVPRHQVCLCLHKVSLGVGRDLLKLFFKLLLKLGQSVT